MHWCTNKAGETQRPITRYHILRLGYWCKQCCGWTCGNTLNILYLSEFAPWRNLSDLFNILYSMLNWCLELIVVFSTVSLRHHTQKKKKQQHLSTNYFGVQLLYCGKLGHDVFVCPNEFIWVGTPNRPKKCVPSRNFVKNGLIHSTLSLFVMNLLWCLTHQMKDLFSLYRNMPELFWGFVLLCRECVL